MARGQGCHPFRGPGFPFASKEVQPTSDHTPPSLDSVPNPWMVGALGGTTVLMILPLPLLIVVAVLPHGVGGTCCCYPLEATINSGPPEVEP